MEPWQLIVLLGALAVVGALIVPGRKAAASGNQSEEMQRMQLALEQFMENMEADNKELVEAIASFRRKQGEEGAARDERTAALETRCLELERRITQLESRFEERLQALQAGMAAAASAAASARETASETPAGGTEVPSLIRERYGELFELHAQGKSIDAIARRTNMNKGEVMLILQLSGQEEGRRYE